MEINTTPARDERREELRLALSMRGGVSLAVWIGGAVAEIDDLRQAGDAETGTAGVYSQLLDLAAYDRVTVDILSGASAGGLNGAIYAASLVYGVSFAQMGGLWLGLGDIESLSRNTPWRLGEEQRTSLLEGDDYFLDQFRIRLARLIRDEEPGYRGALTDRLDLFLSATRKQPIDRILRNDAFSDIGESRSSAFFHFRHLGGLRSPLSDFGADAATTDAVFDTSAARLALAGRASSSFPVAFEPATVRSTPGAPAAGDTGPTPNMFGIFSEAGEVEVIDGGVLDNIPVERAIQAIAAAPADDPADRWLLYLHPSPSDPREEVTDAEAGAGLTGVLSDLATTFTLKFDSESLVDDMAALDRHNSVVAERRATRVSLLDANEAHAESAWAGSDARRITTVLADPDLAFATHPFVTRGFGQVLDGWPVETRAAFGARLVERLTAAYLGRHAGLLALGDTVEVLLTLAQQVTYDGHPEATLYRVRLLVEVLNSMWEQCWTESAVHPPAAIDRDTIDAWIDTADAAATRAGEQVMAELVDHLDAGASDDDEYHQQLEALYAGGASADPVGLTTVWQVVAEQAEVLLANAAELDDPVAQALLDEPATVDDEPMVDRLIRLARRTAPLHRRQLSGQTPIRFLRVSGANHSPLEDWFTQQQPLTVTSKLAGNQLMNFGAFFSARWRANDWMWGRLDSAQSLVDLLADSTRWFGRGGPEVGADEVRARIEAAVKTPFTTDGDRSWGSWIDSRWGALEDRVAAELTQAEANPTIPHPLTATKQVLIERLQAEVMASMLPWVNATPAGEAPDPPSPTSTASRMQTAEQAADLRAGIEKIPSDMEPVRWSRIGMRLGLNAWLALKPTNKLLRVLVTPLKPLYLFVLAIAVFPRRALLAGIVGFAALAVGRWELPTGKNPMFDDLVARRLNPDGYLTWQRVAAAVITVLLAGLLVYIHHLAVRQPQWSRQIRFVEWTAAVVGVVMAACTVVLVIAEVSLPPGIMPVAAVLVVAIAMHWMRPDRWLLCMVIAVAPYLALLPLVGAVDWIDAGWWALLSFGLAVTLTTIYVTLVDVFPARPRMTEDPG